MRLLSKLLGRTMLLTVLVVLSGAAVAVTDAEAKRILEQALASEGYRDIQMSKTWLGRLRIEAHDENRSREIVVDLKSGEVLRDLHRSLHPGLVDNSISRILHSLGLHSSDAAHSESTSNDPDKWEGRGGDSEAEDSGDNGNDGEEGGEDGETGEGGTGEHQD